jgi:leucyl aminopeptidase
MKFQSAFTVALSASAALALSIPKKDVSTEQLLTVELAPGITKQVTEAEKWELRKVSLILRKDYGGS